MPRVRRTRSMMLCPPCWHVGQLRCLYIQQAPKVKEASISAAIMNFCRGVILETTSLQSPDSGGL